MSQPENARAFDNTMIKAFQSCPRYYYWRHVRHLAPRARALPLEFGIALHEGMDAYYSTGKVEEAVQAFAERFAGTEGDDKRNLDNGARILINYAKSYPVEREPWKVLYVEKGFELILDTKKTIHYFGRMDMLIEWDPYGIVVVDHKTSSWISDNYMRAHATDRQFTGYILGATEYFPKVYGAMVNVLEVPKTMSRDPKVQRELVTRSEIDIALWVNETLQVVKQIDACAASDTWPTNAPFYCTAWNRLCDYFYLCTQHKHHETVRVPPEDFVEEPWLPFTSEEN